MQYRERVLIGRDERGKPIYKWACGRNQEELHNAVVRIYVRHGLIGPFLADTAKRQRQRFTFKEYAEAWLITYKAGSIKPTTLAGYKSMLQAHLYPAFGGRVFCEISTKDLQDFLNARSELSRKYLSDMVKLFGMIARDAMEDGVVDVDVTASRKLSIPSDKKTVREALSREDFMDIADHLGALQPSDALFLALLMDTGLRRGEALALRWEDIDRENGVIHIRRNVTYHTPTAHIGTPKTESGCRDVPLTEHLLRLLEPGKDFGYLFPSPRKEDEPICYTTFVRMWRRIGDTIDLHGATPHIFRHTYLTILARMNIDVKTLQAIAGHSDIQITMNRYVHKRTEGLLEAAKRFDMEIMRENFVNASGDEKSKTHLSEWELEEDDL